jgi:nitroreductase
MVLPGDGSGGVPDVDVRSVIEAAVAAAGRAPSVHNTQPWRFVVAGPVVSVLADVSRQLPVLDPTGRQLYVSCGAAVHHLRVALRAGGFDAAVEVLPDESVPELLARVTVRGGQPADEEALALAAAIGERHSQREPFAARQVEHGTLAALRAAAETEGGWLAILAARDDQITLAVLLSHAEAAEAANPEYQEELAHWLRTDPSLDGVPTSALPQVIAGRHSEVPVRDFTAGQDAPAGDAGDVDPGSLPDERPALVILGTDADTPAQWVTAGQALSRLLLVATTLDLRASMLGQVIDLPGTRAQLRTELRLIGEPQMVLRIGYGPPAAATPRRPLADIIDEVD